MDRAEATKRFFQGLVQGEIDGCESVADQRQHPEVGTGRRKRNPAVYSVPASYPQIRRDSPVCGCSRCPPRRDNPILVGFAVCAEEQQERHAAAANPSFAYRWLRPFGLPSEASRHGTLFRYFNSASRLVSRLLD